LYLPFGRGSDELGDALSANEALYSADRVTGKSHRVDLLHR
jgi:hypothetical protein